MANDVNNIQSGYRLTLPLLQNVNITRFPLEDVPKPGLLNTPHKKHNNVECNFIVRFPIECLTNRMCKIKSVLLLEIITMYLVLHFDIFNSLFFWWCIYIYKYYNIVSNFVAMAREYCEWNISRIQLMSGCLSMLGFFIRQVPGTDWLITYS